MRKLINPLIGLITLITFIRCDNSSSIDQPDKFSFIKYYGGDGNQVAADFIYDYDGNFFLLGTSYSGNFINETDSRIYLAKVDNLGFIEWERILGEPGDFAKDIEPTADGNFIILADHHESADNTDIKLIRITASGEKIDSVIHGSQGFEDARSVTPLTDGGYLITGTTQYDTTIILNPGNPDDLADIFHYKCNSSFVFDSFNWYEQEGPGTVDNGIRSFEKSSTEFYVFGASNQFHPGNSQGKLNLYYASINAGGSTKSFNFLGDFDLSTESVFVNQVPVELGGGYIFLGTKSINNTNTTLHVAKLRSNLQFNSADEVWDREISIEARNLSGVSVSSAPIGIPGYLALANETTQDGTRNIWLSKLDLNGNVMWSRTFGSAEEDDFGASVIQLNDGRILLLGTINLINGQSKIALIKLNAEGQLMN